MKKKKKKAEPVEEVNTELVEEVIDNEVEENVEEPEAKELTLEAQIEALNTELAETKDALLRQKADFQNYRKRTSKEISNARIFGQTDTIIPFLQVFDHFSMAMMAAEKSDNMDAIKKGLEMILGEYKKRLDELGVEPIDAAGKKFDPKLHEAMANEPSEEVEEGYVIKQWSVGYKIGERLLRPATVVVSSGPAEAEKPEEENQKEEEQED